MDSFLIIFLASLIGILYLFKIRSFDIYEKEPLTLLILVAIVGGIVSIGVSLFLYLFIKVNYTFFDAIFKIGLVEELSKLFALAMVYRLIKKNFNEIVDGIIYITAISLGFAIIENIFYAFKAEYPFTILAMRSVVSVLGHLSFTGYMGIAFYIHKNVHKNWSGIFLALVLSTLAHGLYDAFLFTAELNLFFILVFISLISFQFWFLRTALGFSAFRTELALVNFEENDKLVNQYCCKCNSMSIGDEISFANIHAVKCKSCYNLIFSYKNTIRLFRYFRPILKGKHFLKKHILKKRRVIALDIEKQVLYDNKTKILSAPAYELSNWLKTSNIKDEHLVFRRPLTGFILKNIGLRYLRLNA